jgi:hypothetical protein
MAHGSNEGFGFFLFARRVKGPWRLGFVQRTAWAALVESGARRGLQTFDPRRAIGIPLWQANYQQKVPLAL